MHFAVYFALCALTLAQPPLAPIYPPVSSWQFFETQIVTSTGTTYGSTFYDSVNQLYRQDRFSGLTDVMCAAALPMTTNTMCSTIVVGGYRYMYYPGLSQCCYCCSDANGCGVLSSNWLDGAVYLGQQEQFGQTVFAWNQTTNIYYETTAVSPQNRVPVGLTREFFDYFQYTDFAPTVPSNAFDLPSECGLTNLCGGLCEEFRNGVTTPRFS